MVAAHPDDLLRVRYIIHPFTFYRPDMHVQHPSSATLSQLFPGMPIRRRGTHFSLSLQLWQLHFSSCGERPGFSIAQCYFTCANESHDKPLLDCRHHRPDRSRRICLSHLTLRALAV